MKPLTLKDIAQAVKGQLNNPSIADTTINGVSFDTREDMASKLFVALKGNTDGHDHIPTAIEKGAVCVFSQQSTPHNAIIVEDCKKALGDLAAYYRSLFDIKVIGITGSNGKTSTKDMVASVLSQRFNVLKTQGNYNNDIGLPMTIFGIDHNTDIAVLEMGMNNRHEITRLGEIARPDVAIITNIGTAHIENLGSQEEIFKAKSEIMDFLSPNGHIFLHGDDAFLARYKDRPNAIFYGRGESHHYQAKNEENKGLEGSSYTTQLKCGCPVDVSIPSAGSHMVTNSLAAVAVGDYLGLDPQEIAQGLASFQASGMRMDVIKLANGTKIIADCYNANPESMKTSLDVLAKEKGNTIAILGDMLELGCQSQSMHLEVGNYAKSLGISQIITIGKEAKHMQAPMHFDSKEGFLNEAGNIITSGSTILVKASRGSRFEDIVEWIKEH